MKPQVLLAIAVAFFTSYTAAQVTSPGRHQLLKKAATDVYHLPSLSNTELLAAEIEQKDAPHQFGKAVDVDIALVENDKNIIKYDNGDWVWRTVIRSEEAVSLNLIFGEWWIPEGSEAYVYNDQVRLHVCDMTISITSDTKLYLQQVIGAIKAYPSNKDSGMFATAPVAGNEIVFEYFSPAFVQELPRIRITKVVHGYKHLLKPKTSSSGSCNVDVACKDGAGWHDQARSVAVILTDNNQKYCTGAMINNLRQDGKQYFLTVSSMFSLTFHTPY